MVLSKRNLFLFVTVMSILVLLAVEMALAAPAAQDTGSSSGDDGRRLGTVDWFSVWKGYGYIIEDGAAEDKSYFVHQSDIRSEGFQKLEGGQRVLFSVTNSAKGKRAVDVFVLEDTNGQQHMGTVDWFSTWKGYGYIVEGSKSYFVHHSNIKSAGVSGLQEGQWVLFSAQTGPKGNQAVDVVVLE